MSFRQVKPFVIANAGTTKYLCLSNVRKGYGIPAHYQTATKAWNGTQQHPDRNFPQGCDVPVFWSLYLTLDGVYADYGHIAVRLADGRVWTDGRYYPNVESLNSGYLSGRGVYLGWGESVNNVKVVEPQGESMQNINDDVARQIGYNYLGRNGYDGRPNALSAPQGDIQGKPLTNAQLSEFFLSQESRNWRDSEFPKVYAERDALRATNTNLNAQVTQLSKAVEDKQKVIDEQSAQITSLTQTVNGQKLEINELADENAALKKEVADLKAQLAASGDTTINFNFIGLFFWFIIKAFGIKK